jgi:hypothetical protein
MITHNLALGFRTQIEANQAALEMDESFDRLAEGFLGEDDEDED